ncbi:two-component system, chemotaxis family, response regulator CheB [Lachnospiraceae bacterium XBB1006]|nr:two-component system, chemotaxis family, response regulator CheB [Lachnospiraceae bacterium XBB1006]
MKKNIMVVDDSALMRRVMCDIINSDSSFEVVDTSRDGQEAYEKILMRQYDAIVLDINMPRMDGLELLRKLKKEKIKVTVIMASTLTVKGAKETVESLELGAFDFVTKPGNVIEAKGNDFATRLLKMLRLALRVDSPIPERKSASVVEKQPVKEERAARSFFTRTVPKVTGSARKQQQPVTSQVDAKPQAKPARQGATAPTADRSSIRSGNKLIALACSTGGPQSLQKVIPLLPAEMDAPMVLVQHMPAGFTKSLAERLNELSKVTVKEAEEGDILKKGHVYVAPGGKHLTVAKRADGTHSIHLDDSPAVGGLKPCADLMYDSLTNCGYDEIVCVVLTGMGEDGCKGISKLMKSKPVYTISQDEATCVVYGMPRAVAEAGVSNKVVPLQNVASTIITNVGVH